MSHIELISVPGIPLITSGDDLPQVIGDALERSALILQENDVLVVTSKIVSKAEGRWIDLSSVVPDERALMVAGQCNKDPRLVSVILSESSGISRTGHDVLIVKHRLGFVCANAGVDHSNTRGEGEWLLLLPENPDTSASRIRDRLAGRFGVCIAVVISDSHGRPFRLGTVGVAIGSAGLPALWDLRGQPDLFGRRLQHTEVGFADELAAAAGLVSGQASEGMPVVIIRGISYPIDKQSTAADLNRPRDKDLYC
ncbi:MAG: coenzyme F420-0:L-glutamate ligase [Anaerolineae bacterium]|nr:coenzyme F420-0:L-glutamate ligase [Anaerolineae bacterium]